MATGKYFFKKYKKSLIFTSHILSLLPKSISEFLWACSSSFGGLLAVGLRYSLLKARCKILGDNVYIGERVIIKNPENLIIGSNVAINAGSYIDAAGGCTIGDNVGIAHGVSILTSNHGWSDGKAPIIYNPLTFSAVEICDDVWIGCGARVLAGVKIESRTVIGAASVINKDVPARSVAVGIPAKVIKHI